MITPRGRVLGRIADHLCGRFPGHPLRVAVDGSFLQRKLEWDEVEPAGRASVVVGNEDVANPVLLRIG
ncbi:hypothetical protein ACIRG5_20255 [Lentzea sp. NPDC102401]|uniref:hypothetical protein n=1 Tax=Lentzea sp. NPDC102401 TaxID=3364128 RepID=UPI00380FE918